MIPIDISKQQELDSDPKAIQQIKINGNLETTSNNIFHYWKSLRNSLRFFA